MKLTDKMIVEALKDGKRIKRNSSKAELRYFAKDGLLVKETCDKRPRRECVASFYLDELRADDWEVVE